MELPSSARDEDATAFVHARWNALVRVAYLMTGDRSAAEDLVQEALARTLVHWQRLDPIGREAYVRTVMSRLAWRRARAARAIDLKDTMLEAHSPVDQTLRSHDVATALGRLPHDQRVIVVLRFWLDLPETEIARMLRCRPGTVKSRASRAYTRLRNDLALADYSPSASLTQEDRSEGDR